MDMHEQAHCQPDKQAWARKLTASETRMAWFRTAQMNVAAGSFSGKHPVIGNHTFGLRSRP